MSLVSQDSSAAHKYIDIIQTVINRMAANSASAKTWCITLVSAVLVFASDKNHPDSMWIALVPVGLFFLLDAYYLGLERVFRSLYNGFVSKLNSGNAESKDLFFLTPSNYSIFAYTVKAIPSFSVWPFYLVVLVMVIVLRTWIF